MNTIEMDFERVPAQPGQERISPDIKEERARMHARAEHTPELAEAPAQPDAGAPGLRDVDYPASSTQKSSLLDHAKPIAATLATPAQASDAAASVAPAMKPDASRSADKDKARENPPPPADSRMQGTEAERIGAAFVASLEARMAKSSLEELGWRDRADLAPVLRDLEVLAGASWGAAANLWDKYRPGDNDKPIFIDGDDKDPEPRSEKPATPNHGAPSFNAPDAALHGAKRLKPEVTPTPTLLAKRYLVAHNKFYFRDDPNLLAFEDKGKRISTEHNDPLIARSMVELAEAKQWASIRVKGTDDFRRAVWLAASLREMEVEGYTPREVDEARLAELRAQLPPSRQNAIEQGPDRTHTLAPPVSAKQQTAPERPIEQPLEDQPEAYRSLSKQQRVAVDTLRAILTERGDGANAVAMVAELAAERFQQQRVYVGRLLAHGRAPYEHKPEEKMNYFVTVKTIDGDRTIWGVDLERAIGVSGIKEGDDMALLYRGRRRVTIVDQVRDPGGEAPQKITKDVNRNSWEAGKLDQLRSEALERLRAAAKATEHSHPLVPVYDLPARPQPRHTDKERGPQPTMNR